MPNLLKKTRRLLATAQRSSSLRQIAETSGDAVQYDWLKRFATGEIPDPSVNRVQALHDHLARRRVRKAA